MFAFSAVFQAQALSLTSRFKTLCFNGFTLCVRIGSAVNEQGIVEGWNLSNDGVNGRRSAENTQEGQAYDDEDIVDEAY